MALWVRILVAVPLVVFTALLGVPILVWLASGHAWLIGALLIVGVAVGVVLALGRRPSFTVTTAGVVVSSVWTSRRIDWAEIRIIEVSHDLFSRGATVVVRHDGRRVIAAITGSRFAIRRGESTFDHGPDLLHPARPARAAIEAHRRYLRGEFRV